MRLVWWQMGRGLALFLVVVMMVVSPAAVSAQSTSSQAAGSSTVEFSEDWQVDHESSDERSVFLTAPGMPGAVFIYGEIVDPVASADEALADFAAGFFGAFGDGTYTEVRRGVVDPDTSWGLYTAIINSLPFGFLVTANIAEVPGNAVITLLMSPVATWVEAAESAQQGITVDAQPLPIASLDPDDLAAYLTAELLLGSATPAATPAASPVRGDLTLPPLGIATPGPDVDEVRGDLTLPPLGDAPDTPTPSEPGSPLTDSVTVNQVEIRWGGGWVYNPASSTSGRMAFFANGEGGNSVFGYATVPDPSTDVALSMERFNDGFFSQFGAANVVQVASDVLPSGRAFALYTADQAGVPYVILTYADLTTQPGEFRAQVLITPRAEFDATFASLRASFTIAGVEPMAELNRADLAALLAGGQPPLTPTGVQATPVAVAPPEGAGSGARTIIDYEVLDTKDACDEIGWVVTAPDQLPVTEAEIDFRSACVGGAAFFASCGIETGSDMTTPHPGTIWVRCDITVRVDDQPLELFILDYTLVDGAGVSHPVDVIAIVGAEDELAFPQGPTAPGQTARGTVAFAIPEDAPRPWVIQVSPIALTGTGTATGTLVIEDELQPFDVFRTSP